MATILHVFVLPLAISFTLTFALVPAVRRFAIECRVADKPNGRRLHAIAIPHFGGVAIFSGFFLGLLVGLATQPGPAVGGRVLALLPPLVILFGLGLVDDLRGLRAGTKLIYQVLAATCAVAMGAGFQMLALGDVPRFVALAVLSLAWYVGVCNSINLIDGLDGLAAGTASIAAAAFAFVAWRVGDPAVALLCACLLGALLAFLRFNFHPARIFMGDTGSMFVGLGLAALACLLASRVGLWTAVLGSAAILGVPIMDTASAIVRRLAARRHIFEADREHTHYRLMRIGLSHRGAVVALYALSGVFALLGGAVLLVDPRWFAGALGLGIAFATALAWRARRVPVTPALVVPANVPDEGLRRPRREIEPWPGRVVPVAAARSRTGAETVVLPPAASGPS